MKTKRRRRGATHRPLSIRERKRWNEHAEAMLELAMQIHERSRDFDTAVRDSISTGLAYIVHAAFDCRSIALGLPDIESIFSYVDSSTAEWFRQRGYVEWFSAGAAQLFHTTPPRHIAPLIRRAKV